MKFEKLDNRKMLNEINDIVLGLDSDLDSIKRQVSLIVYEEEE